MTVNLISNEIVLKNENAKLKLLGKRWAAADMQIPGQRVLANQNPFLRIFDDAHDMPYQ